jgi:hypothetical protein
MAKPGHTTPPSLLLRKQQPTRPSILVARMEAKSHHQAKSRRYLQNYATSKAEYPNTQLDLPGVRSLLLYL